ncbi:MAG: hypothetical protein A4E48_00271 [Methanosaeta sp. PtaU1.Bin060]|nr:MAG: hypothetical protein A4E48_00271 [Methanosaeta sp. PtaU1.Bin060]
MQLCLHPTTGFHDHLAHSMFSLVLFRDGVALCPTGLIGSGDHESIEGACLLILAIQSGTTIGFGIGFGLSLIANTISETSLFVICGFPPRITLSSAAFTICFIASVLISGFLSEINGREALSVNIWAIAGFSKANISLCATSFSRVIKILSRNRSICSAVLGCFSQKFPAFCHFR